MKNQTKEAIFDMEKNILFFYGRMKWILASNRGRNFQFMMLEKTMETYSLMTSQVKERHLGKPEMPKSPLDM